MCCIYFNCALNYSNLNNRTGTLGTARGGIGTAGATVGIDGVLGAGGSVGVEGIFGVGGYVCTLGAILVIVTDNVAPAGEGMIGAGDNIGLPLRGVAAATIPPQWHCPLVCKSLRWAVDHDNMRTFSLLDFCQVLLLLL
jgi:hypothetical protein